MLRFDPIYIDSLNANEKHIWVTETGWHTIKVDISKAGVYIYRMSTPFGDNNGKIVVIK